MMEVCEIHVYQDSSKLSNNMKLHSEWKSYESDRCGNIILLRRHLRGEKQHT